MTGEPFTCSICRDRCISAWSDEEALAELQRDFPGKTPADCDLVCDSCHRLLRGFLDLCRPGEAEATLGSPRSPRVLVDVLAAWGLLTTGAERERLARMAAIMEALADRSEQAA